MKRLLQFSISILLLGIIASSCTKDVDNDTVVKTPTGIIGEWAYKSTDLYLEDHLVMEKDPFTDSYMKFGGNLKFTATKLYYTDEEGTPYFFPYTLNGNELNFFGSKLRIKLLGDELITVEDAYLEIPEVDLKEEDKYQVYNGWQVYHQYGSAAFYIDMDGTILRCQSYNLMMDDKYVLDEDVFYNIWHTHWERIK